MKYGLLATVCVVALYYLRQWFLHRDDMILIERKPERDPECYSDQATRRRLHGLVEIQPQAADRILYFHSDARKRVR